MAPAYSTVEQRYEKISFADMAETKLDATTQAGWAGMLQHYFVTAWTGKADGPKPHLQQSSKCEIDVKDSGEAIIGIKLPITTIAANAEAVVGTSLWIGLNCKIRWPPWLSIWI